MEKCSENNNSNDQDEKRKRLAKKTIEKQQTDGVYICSSSSRGNSTSD